MPKSSSRDRARERAQSDRERERQANAEYDAETADETGSESDIEARNTARQVLELLRGFDGELPTGLADTEEEKLAANLIFLRSMCANYVNRFMNFPQIAEAELERFRVAQDTLRMLDDIVTLNRHPIHRFFRGCMGGVGSSGPSSKEVLADCRILACFDEVADVLLKANGKKPTKGTVLDLMLERPAIAARLKNTKRYDNLRDGPARKPRYLQQVKSCRAMLRWGVGVNATAEQILEWTDTTLDVAERPLSFDEAARQEVQGVARRGTNGALEMLRPRPIPLPAMPPRPSMLTISRLKPAERRGGKG